MGTYLDRILEWHRSQPVSEPTTDEIRAVADLGPTRGFGAALRASDSLAVIAEIKRRSPSRGDLNAHLDPAAVAETYERHGASCLSVLTDVEFFAGSVDDLQSARAAVGIPVLRKDFTVWAADVIQTRRIGADCVLLIAAALSVDELHQLHRLAQEIGLDVLVEIHDEVELDAALEIEATIIGVNQRDLVTFEVDHERAERMASLIPNDVVKVAESGVRTGDDARRLRDAGYDAVLVGESLVTAGDIGSALRDLQV